MLTVPERIVESNSPLGNELSPLKAIRKVVVIHVKGKGGSTLRFSEENRERGDLDDLDSVKNVGRVLANRVVDVKDGRVVFWFISRSAGKNLGFEASFLMGAMAAVVVMELSDHETIQGTVELLRDIYKVFSIPIMLIVGGDIKENLPGFESPFGLTEMASRVVSFAHTGIKAVQAS